jgi:ferritin-like protein
LPTEISDIDKFVQLSEKAEFCAVKRLKDSMKLKLRTPEKLYTLVTTPMKTEEIFKKLKCEIKET